MIYSLLMNLFLAVVYMLLTSDFSGRGVLVGVVVGYILVSIFAATRGQRNYGQKVIKLIRFLFYFMTILTKANLQIAWEIITPGMHQTPRIVRYPIHDLNDVEITTLANCITLTPGTLVVDVSDDGHWLYIHCMYAQDRDQAIAKLRQLDERLRREVFS